MERFSGSSTHGLERLTAKLLDRNKSPIFGKADDIDGEIRFGVRTLLLALASGSYSLLRALLHFSPSSLCDTTQKGGTILMTAFLRGSKQIINIVLKTLRRGNCISVVNYVTSNGQSALTAAIISGRDDHQKQFHSLLMFPGLDSRLAFHQDANGECPLISLALLTYQHTVLPPSAIKANKKRGKSTTSEVLYENLWQLVKAVSDMIHDQQDLPKLCLRLSEECCRKSTSRHTFVHILCQLPQPGCLELLLQSCPMLRSQLHVPNAEGVTSLMQASKSWRHHETFKFILQTPGVDVSHRDEQGRTALSHVAENLGQFSDGGVAARLIDEYGQDPLAVDVRGWSPLHYAIANGNVWEGSAYHQLLTDTTASVECTDEQGPTPLHLAVKGGSPLAIKLLLQHSYSPGWLDTADADGLTPLAHFFSVSQSSKFMFNYNLRLPYSGPLRLVLDISDSSKYHNAALEALQAMFDRPDVLPDIPDNKGKTPLWHALDCMRREYQAFFSAPRTSDGGHFQGFLAASIEALCARDDVDPHKSPESGRTPVELAAAVVKVSSSRDKTRGSVLHADADMGTTAPGDVSGGKAGIRAMIKRLGPMVRRQTSMNKRPPRKR